MKPLTPMPSRGSTRSFPKQCLLFLLLFAFCNANAQLPAAAQQKIDTALKHWNTFYGTNVQALSWKYEGAITTEQQRTDAVNEMADPAKAWIPTGDFTVPSSVNADRVINDATILPADISKYKSMIDGQLKLGQHKVRISWTKGSQAFTTLCITNDTDPVYDDMLGNIQVISQVVNGLAATTKNCLDYTITWIWGGTRGKITASVTSNCDAQGYVVTCDKNCAAYCTLGEAMVECQVETVGAGKCCQLTYAWGWAVGFKSIKLKAGKIQFEVTGILGSSGTGEGSCTQCCDPVSTFGTQPAAVNVSSACESNQVRISWQTTSTLRFKKYTVERSLDGISWDVAGYVDAGTSTATTNNYTFKELNAGTTANFYRVTGEQVTGVKTYSKLVPSACGVAENISVWPNPARGIAVVRMPSSRMQVVTLTVSNAEGFAVFKQQYNLHVGSNEFRVDMKKFAAGIYTLNAAGEGISKVYRIIKADNR